MKHLTKALAILLAIVIGFSTLPLISAAEATDTAEIAAENTGLADTGANNGPSDDHPYIIASLAKGDGYPVEVFSGADNVLQPYGDKLVYDRETNTLTVNNLNAYSMVINEMGEDFKIVLNGYNRLSYINVWGYGWGGSAYITGTGTLELGLGLALEAENSASVLTIDKDVTLFAHDNGIYVEDTTAQTPIVIKGRELSGGVIGHPRMDAVPLVHESNPEWLTTARVYRNTTKPFSNISYLKDTEYFAVYGLTSDEKRADDGEKHHCYKFAVSEAVEKDGEFYVGSHAGYVYAWEDSLTYKMYENNLNSMRISDIDPNYVEVNLNKKNDSVTTLLAPDGYGLYDVAIVPSGSDAINRPRITTDSLPNATEGRAYSAQVAAAAGNDGGRIVDYALYGTASEWLSIDSSGKLSGKAPAFGIYQAIVIATEEANGKRTESPYAALTVMVDLPDIAVTFARTVSDGLSHQLTVTRKSDGSRVRIVPLGTKDLTPATAENLGELPDGNYSVTFTGEGNGVQVSYGQNKADFTVKNGKCGIITLELNANLIYDSTTAVVKVPNIYQYKSLGEIKAHIVLSDGSVATRVVRHAENILPYVLKANTRITRVVLAVPCATGEEIAIADSDTTTAAIDDSIFAEYSFVCETPGLSRVTLSYDGAEFTLDDRETYLFPAGEEAPEFTFVRADSTPAIRRAYNLSVEPAIEKSPYGNAYYISFPAISRTGTLSGTVTGEEGKPVCGASVTVSQTLNGESQPYNAVTDNNGKYTIKNLILDIPASYSVRAEGNIAANGTVKKIQSSTALNVKLKQEHILSILVDREVFGAHISVKGAMSYHLSGVSGSRFAIAVDSNVSGKVTVELTASNVAGSVTGETEIVDHKGVVILNPTAKGVIDWTGYDDKGNATADCNGFDVNISGKGYSRRFSSNGAKTAELDPGAYTVSIIKPATGETVATQKLTVKSDKTVYVTASIPSGASDPSFSGRLSGPKTATVGSVYKLSGLITSTGGREIEELYFQKGDTMSWNNNVDNVVINGKPAAVQNGHVKRSTAQNADIDWSLPMSITVYCTQDAGSESALQTVSAYVSTGRGESMIGSVTTRYIPNLTLYTPERVGGIAQATVSGVVYYVPAGVDFSGKTTPNTQVTIYDNNKAAAVVTSDAKGNYKGVLSLMTSDASHTIRAQATLGGYTAKATSNVTYDPEGAILASLTYNQYKLPIDGSSMAYTVVPSSTARFSATFENEEALEDQTFTVDGKEVTSKVFFEIKTVGATKLVPAEKSGSAWWSKEYAHGAEYPTGVRVVYRSKKPDDTTVTYIGDDGQKITTTVGRSLLRVTDDAGNSRFITAHTDALATAQKPSPATTSADTDGTNAPNRLYQDYADAVNAQGKNACSSITAKQAAEKCPDGMIAIVSYNDAPDWPVNARDFELKKTELVGKGYTVVSSKDEKTGHTLFLFKGSFYYDATAKPVPSLYITNTYSGIQKCEEDPRMFKDGVMLGSTLDVVYICDINEKKWLRMQNAIIPANAMSPIHTTSTQIPCKTDAPIEYSSAGISPIALDGSDLAATGDYMNTDNPAGLKTLYNIRLSDVSTKTYTQGALSVASYGVGLYAGAKIENIPFEGFDNATKEMMIKDLKGISDMACADTFCFLGKVNENLNIGGATYEQSKEMFSKKMQDNIRYWGTVKEAAEKTNSSNNGGYVGDYSGYKPIADMMISNSRDLANEFVKFELTVENAGIQNELTARLSEGLGAISMILAVGGQPHAALLTDALNFMINAANDTNNAEVIRNAENIKKKVEKFIQQDQEMKKYVDKDEKKVQAAQASGNKKAKTIEEITGKNLNDPFNPNKEYGEIDPVPGADDDKPEDEPGGDTPGGDTPGGDTPGGDTPGGDTPGGQNPGGGSKPGTYSPSGNYNNHNVHANMKPVHDPSGIVYEAVLSNPVEGATVTLHRYLEENPLSVWDDSEYLNQPNPVLSDANGLYRWDVPEGEWYVTAAKDGYVTGSSQNDKAATVRHGDVSYLPVLPPQLEVNIPLVSYAAPEVSAVSAKSDGVYIAFTKYMDEATLKKENFTLTDASGNAVAFTLELLDSEQAPANIRYEGEAPSYTRNIRLKAALKSGSAVILRAEGELSNYAGVAMTAPYNGVLTVEKKAALPAPTFSVASGDVEKGTLVTINCADGAELIYTTDGSEPSRDNGVRAKNGEQLALIISTELKAIAVSSDSNDSPTATASYTVVLPVVGQRLKLGDVDADGDVTIVDATMIQRHLAELPTSSYHEEVADTDHDGVITIIDATTIQRVLVGLDPANGIGEYV